MPRLTGRVALITGAGRGIGAGIAERFVEEGAAVVVADRDGATAEATAARLAGRGTAIPATGDISRKPDVDAIVARTLARFGRIDVLVQNAGIFPWTLIENTSPEEWDRVLAVNLKGTFLMAQACLPAMKERHYGRMVFTSSITGPRVSAPGNGHYSASKAGINGFIRAAAIEFARQHRHRGRRSGQKRILHREHEGHDPARPAGDAARRRQRGALPRLRRGRVHHRHDDHRRRRADPAGGQRLPHRARPAGSGIASAPVREQRPHAGHDDLAVRRLQASGVEHDHAMVEVADADMNRRLAVA